MSKLMKSVKALAGVAVLSTVAWASPALAVPDECIYVCDCDTPCNTHCFDWTTNRVITCRGAEFVCQEVCAPAPKLSMSESQEQQSSDDASGVCSEPESASQASSQPAES